MLVTVSNKLQTSIGNVKMLNDSLTKVTEQETFITELKMCTKLQTNTLKKNKTMKH